MKYNKDGTVRFNLKKQRDKEGKSIKKNLQIWMSVSISGDRLRYYTGKRIDLNKWDESKQRSKSDLSLNAYLKDLRLFIEDEINRAAVNKEMLNIRSLKAKILEYQNKIQSDFFLNFEKFIESNKLSKSERTIKKYNTAKKHLENFEREMSYKLTFLSINKEFDELFTDYLIKEAKLTNNTITKYVKVLKTFMNYCTERGINKDLEYMKFKTRENKPEINVLTWEELMKILNLDLKNKKLERIRDIFCFGCFTGLRFSDIMNLKSENIKDEFILVNTIKNKKAVYIPITKYSRAIIDKYNEPGKEFLFNNISNQKFNEYLQELGEEAKINEKVQVVRYRGNERIEQSFDKWEIMTSHMARRTFITSALRFGMPAEVIMEITGHTDHKIFERYYKIANEHKKSEMLKAFK
jgi:integrase